VKIEITMDVMEVYNVLACAMYANVEVSALPVPCPLQQRAYYFTYNNESGGFCRSPTSYVRACAASSHLLFSFKHCRHCRNTFDRGTFGRPMHYYHHRHHASSSWLLAFCCKMLRQLNAFSEMTTKLQQGQKDKKSIHTSTVLRVTLSKQDR